MQIVEGDNGRKGQFTIVDEDGRHYLGKGRGSWGISIFAKWFDDRSTAENCVYLLSNGFDTEKAIAQQPPTTGKKR